MGYILGHSEDPISNQVLPMNAINALAFAALGSLMELLPRAFPSWFPHTGADESSCRALWLSVMGATQITVGLGFLLTVHALPYFRRLFIRVPSTESGTLVLTESRRA
jgi:hypothetical protein